MLTPTVNYLQPPATIVNQALDRLGADDSAIIGDVTDGSRVGEVARRNYGQAVRQLLRTAHWNFARKRARLTLLGDTTGNSAPPISPFVECPWGYAYAWPLDGVQGRWLPWNPINAQPEGAGGIPITTGVSASVGYSSTPGRFLISSSDQYPLEVGSLSWDQLPDLQRTEGVGPINRKIVLTDTACAEFVYTRLETVIEMWDDLFRESMVMMMALVLAPIVVRDPRLRIEEVSRLTLALKTTIADARVANGNEAGWPQTTDFEASFIRGRNQYGWGLAGGSNYTFGPLGGYFGCGFESMSWAGSVY